jgi:peptidoglycan-associated lipoprotein
MKIMRVLSVIVMIMALFAGCQKPPKVERELAEKAFRDALVGKDCARENYIAAEELLQKAREAINNKEFDKAKDLFLAVKKKSDEILEYYRTHPDECLPKEEVVEEDKEEEIVEENDPAKDPNMAFPIIHFEFDRYTVVTDDMEKLFLVAEWLKNFPEAVLRVEGNADERGAIDYNMSLGEKRGREVKNQLIQLGIAPERLKVVSYGEEKPINPAHNEQAWYENRRVEFVRIN